MGVLNLLGMVVAIVCCNLVIICWNFGQEVSGS